YYAVVGRTLLVSMYHGGIWAVDLSPALDGERPFTSLRSVGVFLSVDPTVHVAVPMRWAPTLEEVLPFADGTVATFDGASGIWTFTFDADDPAPSPEPWPITPP
ncbi:MAG: hypothetical protein LC620_01960, partial [Halobacteriales archaeon]|nr:hypothetical protein [Halobacteriales archaeon]